MKKPAKVYRPMIVAKMDNNKKRMIAALEESLGNVSVAVRKVGIVRATHYNWMEDDAEYKAMVESVQDVALDYVENKLMNLINANDTSATIFFLKCKGKRRGYVERTEVETNITAPVTITVVPASQSEKLKALKEKK